MAAGLMEQVYRWDSAWCLVPDVLACSASWSCRSDGSGDAKVVFAVAVVVVLSDSGGGGGGGL